MAFAATGRKLGLLSRYSSILPKHIKSSTVIPACQYGSAPVGYDDKFEGAEKRCVTLIPGDGVGPELTGAVKHVFKALGVPVEWDEVYVSDIGSFGGETSLDKVVTSMEKTRVALMGALTTPSIITSSDARSLNQNLRLQLDLFANVVHCKSLPGIPSRHKDIDVVVVREQTEGEYSSLEHESVPGVIEMLKVITRKKSQRIAKFAFDFAMKNDRKKVTCVHKANIMKLGDGLFLESCTEVAKMYPRIQFETMIVDNTCMQLVSNPQQFDVMVMPNLYGGIAGNLSSGLVGGAGVVPGRSYGKDYALFESGARHTFAHKAGRNIANPTALMIASCNLLEHIHFRKYARMIRDAIYRTIAEGKYVTMDVGGSSSTSLFVNRVIQNAQVDLLK